MKKVFVLMITMALILLPLTVYAQSDQSSKAAPPVSQTLVPEGDFALKLVPALGLGTPGNEAQAEDMLTSVGIAPKNGWIADYPITPDIIGELQDGVVTAADSNKLPMGKDDALKAFQNLTTEFGLGVVAGGSGQYAENQPQPDPTVINNYYYEEGPPVVTYYPPPWDYYYLYAWVPYPFWSGGFFFSGFFCLHDFHRVVFVGRHRFVVSNHVINPVSHTVMRVDPIGRRTGNGFRTGDISHHRGFTSTEARRGATSIFERSRGQATTMPNKSTRSVRQPGNFERANKMTSRASSPGESRSFRSPGVTRGGSFNSPSTGNRNFSTSESSRGSFGASGRSFSGPSRGSSSTCANCHGGSGSFGRSAGGGSSGGFSSGRSSGGFSGGHSFGGFSGGGFSGGHGGGGRGR